MLFRSWLDRKTLAEWTDSVWRPFVYENFKNKEPLLLTCDSVDAQRWRSFSNDLATCQTTHFLGEPTYTHVWQMIDRHLGKTLRDLYSDIQLEHLAVDGNWEKFVNLTASERRILVTQWAGEAWRTHSHRWTRLWAASRATKRNPGRRIWAVCLSVRQILSSR